MEIKPIGTVRITDTESRVWPLEALDALMADLAATPEKGDEWKGRPAKRCGCPECSP